MLLDSTAVLLLPGREMDLSPAAMAAIRAAQSLSISIASVWELQIKESLRKVELPQRIWERLAARGATYLPIEIEDTIISTSLPLHHRDPFDRMIIAQAMRRNLPIVTRDRKFADYGVPVVWA